MSSLKTDSRRHPGRLRFDISHKDLFETQARTYDRYRPAYPEAVIREMLRLSRLTPKSRLLEIGCGTGQATLAIARTGYAMDCVDPGKSMIRLARERCREWPQVRFHTIGFEKAALQPRAYDLAFSAHAFHWIAPAVRLRKTVRLLQRGGSLALLYNYPGVSACETMTRLSKMIQRESRGMLSMWHYQDDVRNWTREIRESRLFHDLTVCRHSWHLYYTAEEYVGLLRTYPDFLSLPGALQQRVSDCIKRFVDAHGGIIRRPYDCLLIHARKAEVGA